MAGFRARPRFTLGLRLCDDKSAFVFPVCDFNLILTDLKSANCCRAYMTCLGKNRATSKGLLEVLIKILDFLYSALCYPCRMYESLSFRGMAKSV